MSIGNLVSFEIQVGGSAIKDEYQVHSIEIRNSVNRITSAHFVLQDGSPAKEDFPISDSSDFVPGGDVTIQLGYGGTNTTVFKGVITSQQISVTELGSFLEVECRDEAVKMTIGKNNNYFQKMTDSAIMSQLIGNYSGVSSDVKSTSYTHPEVIQYYASDWDFVVSRADINGMVVITDQNKVTVQPPDVSGSGVATVTYGDDIKAMHLSLDARTQLGTVEANSWDYSSQQVTNSSAADPSVPSQGNVTGSSLSSVTAPSTFSLQTTAPLESDALQVWANAQLLKSRFSLIQGSVKVTGNSTFVTGKLITLKGCGERFNGDAYVSGVYHEVNEGVWWTTVTLGLTSEWFADEVEVTPNPSSGLLPGVRGLQNGTVKQIDSDPDGENRILVTFPLITSGTDGVWARLASYYATNNAGNFFMPEVGDEVVVGFLNEDPRFPVILGSMYSSSNFVPPYTPDSDNQFKAIVTKSQMKVIFDDTNKIITIETPGGNKIVFSDQDQNIQITDQNNNQVTMDSSGITMKSPSDINIQADGNVNIKGTGGVKIETPAQCEISADGGLKGSGATVEFDADAEFKANGAVAQINGSGEVKVAGGIVMIN